MNFLPLRLKQIFDSMNQNSESPSPFNPTSYNPPPVDPNQGLNTIATNMYTPETKSIDRFNQMVDDFPTQPKPSFGRRLGAGALAATADIFGNGGGKNIWDEMSGNNDYKKNVDNWKTQIGPVEQAANIERQTNANERMVNHQQISDRLKEEAQAAKIKGDEVKNKIAQQKADAYEFKARNPGMKFDFTGPKVKVLDPTSGKITVTEFDTGNLSETDKINLQQQGKMEQIDAQGKNANTVAETRGWKIGTIPNPDDPTKQIGVRYNEITGETVPIKVNGQATTITPTNANAKPVANNDAIQQKTRDTLAALDELLDDKGKLRPEITPSVGASRMFGMQFLPATQAKAGDAAIKRLKSMLTIELLGEMKAQSRTGATGFGQLSVKELNVLESAASKLDPSLDEGTFEKELNRIKEYLKKVLQPKDGLTDTTTVKKPTAQELIRKYGG